MARHRFTTLPCRRRHRSRAGIARCGRPRAQGFSCRDGDLAGAYVVGRPEASFTTRAALSRAGLALPPRARLAAGARGAARHRAAYLTSAWLRAPACAGHALEVRAHLSRARALRPAVERASELPASSASILPAIPAGRALKPLAGQQVRLLRLAGVDDARLVVLHARDAADRRRHGSRRARAFSRRGVSKVYGPSKSKTGGVKRLVFARALVNAAGPFADEEWRALRLMKRAQQSAEGEARQRQIPIVVPHASAPRMAYLRKARMDVSCLRCHSRSASHSSARRMCLSAAAIPPRWRLPRAPGKEVHPSISRRRRFFARILKAPRISSAFRRRAARLIDDGEASASAISARVGLALDREGR